MLRVPLIFICLFWFRSHYYQNASVEATRPGSMNVSSLSVSISAIEPAANTGKRPPSVHVGALVAIDSTIGQAAKAAIHLAVNDVNNSPEILNGTQFNLSLIDSKCNSFWGTEAAIGLLKQNVIGIIGPQHSVLAHVVSHITTQLQIPLVSYSATDPTLTSSEYPFFVRMTHNDMYQMRAIADLVHYFNWRGVAAVYIDDEYGRNGVSALGDALLTVGVKFSNKVPMIPGVDLEGMGSTLQKVMLMDTRIFVVHMNSDDGLRLFSAAKDLGMLSTGYVWIVTDWLSSVLDSGLLEPENMSSLQGLVSLRPFFPSTPKRPSLNQRWKTLKTEHVVNVSLNSFGLYAYDTVWVLAHAIDTFLNQGGEFSFVDQSGVPNPNGSTSDLATLKVLEAGSKFRDIIMQTKFEGTTRHIEFDSSGDLKLPNFEIINVAGTGFRKIGYWSNSSGLSVTPPETAHAMVPLPNGIKAKLHDVIWPGESKSIPRGWVLPENGRELVIGVPRKVGFREFVSVEDDDTVTGFCIDVFLAAVKLLPYNFQYRFKPFSTRGNLTPSYEELVDQLALKGSYLQVDSCRTLMQS